jgi:pantothenate kinase type III
MRKIMILITVGITVLVGCASYLSYSRQSTNDIPFEKRKPLSLEKAIILSTKGPQLEPKFYEIIGKVRSQVENISSLQNHCKDAFDMLRYEAESVGADALIDVSCSSEKYSAQAFGTAITFTNREEVLKVLRDINAIVE